MMFEAQIGQLRERWERMSPRERTLVSAAGATFALMIVIISGFLITDGLATLEERNSDTRQALHDLDTQRDNYLRAKAKASQLEARVGHTPVQLQGFLEQVAKESGVEIPESNERAAAPAGKQYMEHSLEIRLKQVTLPTLTKFLKGIENGPNLVVVTALSVHTRDDKHEDLEVEMTVTTYEKAAEKKDKPGEKKGDKT